MKNLFFSALIASVSLFFTACGASYNNYDAAADGIERIFNDVKRSVGEDGQIDELSISFSNEKGQTSMISYFVVDFQSKSDKNKLQRVSYHSYNGWSAIEPVEITVTGGNASEYDLNDDVNSIAQVKTEVVRKIYDSALQKLSETCDDITFVSLSADLEANRDVEYSAYLQGTLKSNGVKDKFFFDYDKDGNQTK